MGVFSAPMPASGPQRLLLLLLLLLPRAARLGPTPLPCRQPIACSSRIPAMRPDWSALATDSADAQMCMWRPDVGSASLRPSRPMHLIGRCPAGATLVPCRQPAASRQGVPEPGFRMTSAAPHSTARLRASLHYACLSKLLRGLAIESLFSHQTCHKEDTGPLPASCPGDNSRTFARDKDARYVLKEVPKI